MNNDALIDTIRQSLELELKDQLQQFSHPPYEQYRHMLAYHLGWEGEGAGAKATGKRIRPLLLLLVTDAGGGAWENALPAAAAVELVHNFSLIHDDIEDKSQYRRGRLTVWTKWGIAQGVNAGDAMFTLAHLSMHRLSRSFSPDLVLQCSHLLLQTCIELTQGQFLDIEFETKPNVSIAEYWGMIQGKTSALFSACAELGAITAKSSPETQNHYRRYGRALGLAFQVIDDILGIWGDEAMLGKSTSSDLCSGKKTLPVLMGIKNQGKFANRWQQGHILPEEVPVLAKMLEDEGVLEMTRSEAIRLTNEALDELYAARPQGTAGKVIIDLTHQLTTRSI
jgi:geranylgeranyl diphosphate synthase type I